MVPPIKALTFDVFGTVVDWRTSIARDGAAFAAERGITHVDWTEFADEFRAGYEPMMARVRRGELPFQPIDALHRRILDDELLPRFGLQGLGETERDHLNRVWHRLCGWPDARTGLLRLRQSFTIASLSNGNVALLTNMAKHADLRWDCVLSAELSQHYKPDPEVYLTAARLLGETACRHRTRSSRHPAAANCGGGRCVCVLDRAGAGAGNDGSRPQLRPRRRQSRRLPHRLRGPAERVWRQAGFEHAGRDGHRDRSGRGPGVRLCGDRLSRPGTPA